MTTIPIRMSSVIALLATIGYCWAVWYAGTLFAILVGPDGAQNISNFSLWTIMPLDTAMSFNMIHWQLLAVLSFCVYVAVSRGGGADKPNPAAALALVNHYGALLLFVFINMIGFGISTIAICYEI